MIYRTRQSATDAMTALNDKHYVPGSQTALVVRAADGETKGEDRKLFIGMLSYTTTDEYLRGLFSRYGTLEEVAVIRGPDGVSKGCGFVKFSTRLEALAAIDALNDKFTAEGSRAPLQVRFAETEKEKAAKKMQRQMGGGMGGMGYVNPAAQMMGNPMAMYQQMQYPGMQFGGGYGMQPDISAAFSGVQQYQAGGYGGMPYAQQSPYGAAPVRTSRPHPSGPEGANLFILNLPPDATDDTLRSIFGPYGNVVSTLVYMDKITKMSKQFGFVSFDNVSSANAAIQALHGYNLNGYVLKVSLKKNTPY